MNESKLPFALVCLAFSLALRAHGTAPLRLLAKGLAPRAGSKFRVASSIACMLRSQILVRAMTEAGTQYSRIGRVRYYGLWSKLCHQSGVLLEYFWSTFGFPKLLGGSTYRQNIGGFAAIVLVFVQQHGEEKIMQHVRRTAS